jgi:hypothetical protein
MDKRKKKLEEKRRKQIHAENLRRFTANQQTKSAMSIGFTNEELPDQKRLDTVGPFLGVTQHPTTGRWQTWASSNGQDMFNFRSYTTLEEATVALDVIKAQIKQVGGKVDLRKLWDDQKKGITQEQETASWGTQFLFTLVREMAAGKHRL